MARKNRKQRTKLQITFRPETEQDVIDFINTLKKPEVHVTVVSAFRMYMRATGFYEVWEKGYNSSGSGGLVSGGKSREKFSEGDKEGIVDETAFRELGGMFERENDLKD